MVYFMELMLIRHTAFALSTMLSYGDVYASPSFPGKKQ